jgi:hypothetical protein
MLRAGAAAASVPAAGAVASAIPWRQPEGRSRGAGDVGAEGRLEVRSAVLLERSPDGKIRVLEGADNAIGYLLGATGAVRGADADVTLAAISEDIAPRHTVLIAEVGEVADEVLDKAMADLGGTASRRPATEVYDEIQSADVAQEAADKEARRVLRVGLQEDGATFTIPQHPVRRRIHGIRTFSMLCGGEYFFMPSLSALRWIGDLRQSSGPADEPSEPILKAVATP